MNETVDELKHFNARRKLKGAVQAIASGVSLDPLLCCTDIDAGRWNLFIKKALNQISFILNLKVPIGTASVFLNEWADEDAGIEAVQRILDALDDVSALQDQQIDPDVLISMLRDGRLHSLLEVELIQLKKIRQT